jgi:hypothetical protein
MKACLVDLGVKAIDDVCGCGMPKEEAGVSPTSAAMRKLLGWVLRARPALRRREETFVYVRRGEDL